MPFNTRDNVDDDQRLFRRRRVLAASSAGLTAAIAGCSSSDNADEPETGDDADDTESGDNTDSDTGDGEEDDEGAEDEDIPEYTIEGDVPDEVEVGEELTYAMTIANDGDAVEATYGLDLSFAGDESVEPVFSDEITLSDGESESMESDPFTLGQAGTLQWMFYVSANGQDEVVDTQETVIVNPSRAWGRLFRTPTDLIVTASKPRLMGRYEYEDYGGDTQVHRADDGEQFAFIDLSVENDAGEPRETPNRLSFELVAGNQQLEPMGLSEYERDNVYDGLNNIADGIVKEGVQPFVIPDDLNIDSLQLFYDDTNIEADASWTVTWG